MWIRANRGRMAAIEKRTKRYPSNLTDEEWERIALLLLKPAKKSCKPAVNLREILKATRYMARSGGGWRMLPRDFSPWQTAYWWFRRFVRLLQLWIIHDVALMIDRERAGRAASLTAGVIDSQLMKAPAAKKRGYNAAKRIVGRKRRIAVDTDGRRLMVNLTTADIADSAGAQIILRAIRRRRPCHVARLLARASVSGAAFRSIPHASAASSTRAAPPPKPPERRGLFWSFTGYSCAVYVDDLRRRSTHGLGNSCSRLIGAESYMAGRRRL
jgi:transposase